LEDIVERRALIAVAALAAALSACGGGGAADPDAVGADGLDATPEVVPATETAEPSPTPTPSSSPSPDPSATPSPTATPTEQEAPTFEEACAGRDNEAFIEVLTPRPDATVGQAFTVTGCGNTFEANYQYRVELSDGTTAAEGFGTMSCGNGCVGEFEQEVTVDATGPVTLVLFESSPEDGSEESVVEVPLTVEQ
jgi:hypothetical protein